MSCHTHVVMTQNAQDRPKRLRVGIVGGGFMAEVHCRAARSTGAQVVGLASSSAPSAERAAERLDVPRAYSTVEELLADESLDVVHVCTTNVTHAAIAESALEADKHVVCEKPLAVTPEAAASLVGLASRQEKIATVPFVYRFHPMVREARARILSGELGDLTTVQGSYLQDWLLNTADDNWRVDAEVSGPSRAFADIGTHLCDMVEFVTDDRISHLFAQTRTVFKERATHKEISTEDVVTVLFQTAGGLLGTLLISQVAPGRKNRLSLEVNGQIKSLLFDQEAPETLWLGGRDSSQIITRAPETLRADAARLALVPAGHPQGYQDAFNGFVTDTYAAIRGSTPEGLPSFVDGLRASELTAVVLASAKEGVWMPVPETTVPPSIPIPDHSLSAS